MSVPLYPVAPLHAALDGAPSLPDVRSPIVISAFYFSFWDFSISAFAEIWFCLSAFIFCRRSGSAFQHFSVSAFQLLVLRQYFTR